MINRVFSCSHLSLSLVGTYLSVRWPTPATLVSINPFLWKLLGVFLILTIFFHFSTAVDALWASPISFFFSAPVCCFLLHHNVIWVGSYSILNGPPAWKVARKMSSDSSAAAWDDGAACLYFSFLLASTTFFLNRSSAALSSVS